MVSEGEGGREGERGVSGGREGWVIGHRAAASGSGIIWQMFIL